MIAKPAHEIEEHRRCAHPGREAHEAAQRFHCVPVGVAAANVTVDPQRVGPIRLDRDGREPVLLDQPPRDRGTLAIKLMSSVRRLANEHDVGVAGQLEDPGVRIGCFGGGCRAIAQEVLRFHDACPRAARPSESRTSASVTCVKS